ncbi:MAG: aspartate--tRNA(Asn) ligase [Aigarchaeota archaeon]|nr:aspartate--tRNA(Asn) ligase [Aigarchaeota archaeon]MDW8092150.1 aspartate--tRNA(Asn) ligase [Nitrososphaerota archaeon]
MNSSTVPGRIPAGSLSPQLDGKEGYVLGWVHEVRDLGHLIFVVLRDGTGLCQVSIKVADTPEEVVRRVRGITNESVVKVWGRVTREPKARAGVEFKGREVEVISRTERTVPYDVTGKVDAKLDTRLDHRILDLRRPENRAIFLIGDTVLSACRSFLRERGFIEVRTPRIIATATEGGAALFEVNYFDRRAYLAQSPQLYKEELVTVFERVFEIGPFFRAEESNTTVHINEFTSIDIEAAFADYNEVMEVLEKLMVHVYQRVIDERGRELSLLNLNIRVPQLPFMRVTYDEALEYLREVGMEKRWGEDLSVRDMRALTSKYDGFYFITDFPTVTKPFYIKPRDGKPEVSESFDLVHGWLELASGGSRISERSLLERRIVDSGLNPASFQHHLDIYDYGMPPHAGWGLGYERLLMIITNRMNVREATLFPRDRTRLTP